MKENIDKVFEKSLEGFEMPYDPKAWEAMSKKLDQKMPTGGNSNWKWYLGGAAVICVAVGAALMMDDGETKDVVGNNQKVTEISNPESNSTSADIEQTVKANESANNNSVSQSEQSTTSTTASSEGTTSVNTNDVAQQTNTNQPADNNNNVQSNQQRPNTNVDQQRREIEVKLPEISSVCTGETIKIDNRENEVAIYVIDPSGNRTSIKAESKGTYKPIEDGTYYIAQIADGKVVKKESFQVLSLPLVDMTYDDEIKYENGVPTTTLTSGSVGSSFEWNLGPNMGTVYGKTVEAHYFKDDNYTVSLTVTGSNGCKATESMKINIDNNYNLLAVDAFNPNSTIDANRTFMPYALTKRNTPFTLMILDPSTGVVIYETSDVSQPWTGVDRRNGQMVEFNKSFVWKVVLKNPMKGERSDYAGSVVLTSFR